MAQEVDPEAREGRREASRLTAGPGSKLLLRGFCWDPYKGYTCLLSFREDSARAFLPFLQIGVLFVGAPDWWKLSYGIPATKGLLGCIKVLKPWLI